jgi:hypothetical protein
MGIYNSSRSEAEVVQVKAALSGNTLRDGTVAVSTSVRDLLILAKHVGLFSFFKAVGMRFCRPMAAVQSRGPLDSGTSVNGLLPLAHQVSTPIDLRSIYFVKICSISIRFVSRWYLSLLRLPP